MHIKRDTKTRGGKPRTYLSLAHNVRKTTEGPDGRKKHQTTPVIFANLGAEGAKDIPERNIGKAEDAGRACGLQIAK